jgi:hypothetical protein
MPSSFNKSSFNKSSVKTGGDPSSKTALELEVFEQGSNQKPKGVPEQLHYPFRICIVASTGQGKTNLIKNIIFKFYEPVLEKVFYLTPKTATLNQVKNHFEKRKPSFDLELFRKFDNKKLEELVDDLDEEGTHSVFVVEDLMSANVSNKHKNNVLDKIVQNGREANINSIISSQRYKDLNPNQRKDNCSMLIIMERLGEGDIKTLLEEQKINIKQDQMEQLLNDYAGQQFDFLVIDYTEPIDKRFKNSKFEPINVNSNDDDDDGHEVLKGSFNKSSFNKSSVKTEGRSSSVKTEGRSSSVKTEGKSEDKSNSKTESKPASKDIVLQQFDKEGDKITAKFKVNGKEKNVSFRVKDDSFVKSKKLADRRKFIQSMSKEKRTNPSDPTDPKILERYLLNETTSLKDNLQIYIDKFKIQTPFRVDK